MAASPLRVVPWILRASSSESQEGAHTGPAARANCRIVGLRDDPPLLVLGVDRAGATAVQGGTWQGFIR